MKYGRYRRWNTYRNKRRALWYAKHNTISSAPVILPDQYFAKLRYVVRITSDTGASDPHGYDVSGNNIYNPDPNTTSETVAGFDIYSQMYERWCVMGSSYKVTFVNNVAADAGYRQSYWLYLRPHRDSPANVDYDYFEQPDVSTSQVGNKEGEVPMAVMKRYASSQKILEVPQNQLVSTAEYNGGSNTGPATQWWWVFNFANAYPVGADDIKVAYEIRVTYYVLFRKRWAVVT